MPICGQNIVELETLLRICDQATGLEKKAKNHEKMPKVEQNFFQNLDLCVSGTIFITDQLLIYLLL